MSEVQIAQSLPELPRTVEKLPSVGGDNFFLHTYAMNIDSAGTMIVEFQDLLKDWLPGKGTVYFEGVMVAISFDDAKGAIFCGMQAKGASVSDVKDLRAWPNRKKFSSNAYNYGVEERHEFDVPEGYTTQLFPMTGPLPLPQFVIASTSDVRANCDLFIRLRASGPYVTRHVLTWKSGSVANSGGF